MRSLSGSICQCLLCDKHPPRSEGPATACRPGAYMYAGLGSEPPPASPALQTALDGHQSVGSGSVCSWENLPSGSHGLVWPRQSGEPGSPLSANFPSAFLILPQTSCLRLEEPVGQMLSLPSVKWHMSCLGGSHLQPGKQTQGQVLGRKGYAATPCLKTKRCKRPSAQPA